MIFLKKRRGQAFETMMLVISVIVAIAILGVLTGILGGISGPGADWKKTVTDSLKEVGTYGVTSAKTITIKKGDTLDAKAATKDIATFSASQLKFVTTTKATADFDGGLLGNTDNSELSYQGSSSQKQYEMVVAANSDLTTPQVAFVCVGTTTDPKTENAATKCRDCRDGKGQC